MLQLLRHQPNRSTVFAWLRAVAIREAWRLDRVARRTVDIDTIDEDDLPQYQDTNLIEAHRLFRTVRDLSPHQRRVLLLFVSGYPYKEIAARHDLSATAINKALVRARRHLRLVHDAS